MDTIENYRSIIKKVLTEYVAVSDIYDPSEIESEYPRDKEELIISEDKNSYILVLFEFYYETGKYHCLVHLEIQEEKIIIYRDDVRYGIDRDLIDLGIPQDKIIHFFNKPHTATKYVVNYKRLYDLNKEAFTVESSFEKPIIKPLATSTQLIKLAKISRCTLNKQIARHPHTPPDLLIEFFICFYPEVLKNPSLNLLVLEDPLFLEKLYQNNPSIFQKPNLDIPEFFIEWAIKNKQERIRAYIASSKTIAVFFLEKLLNDSSCAVIQNLYLNPNLSLNRKEEILQRKLQLQNTCKYFSSENSNCENGFCSILSASRGYF